MSLAEKISKIIKNKGPISLYKFIEMALMDEDYGYYKSRNPFGSSGDFITAPEVSQMFGELIAAWLITAWQEIGSPEKAALVELGPGRGTMMNDIIRVAAKVPGLLSRISIHMVEESEALRDIQKRTLEKSGRGVEINWHRSFSEIPDVPIILIANEFFDALPIHQFVYTSNGWRERMVTENKKGELEFCLSQEKTPACKMISKEFLISEQGAVFEFSPAAKDIIKEISLHIKTYGGSALIIDYGYFFNEFKDSLQAVKNHKFHKVLSDPGQADITTHVNFEMLAETAQEEGIYAFGDTTQGEFLLAMGIELRATMLAHNAKQKKREMIISEIKRLISPQEMGTLFKCLALTDKAEPTPYGFNKP